MTFREKLHALRKASGLSQEQFAEKCNVTRQSVSKWELGQGYPETEKLLMLCRVLDVDLDYLLREEIACQTTPKQETIANPYQQYLGKWTMLLLYDRDLGAIPCAAIAAMNHEYIVFCVNGKMGVIRSSDIQAISEARLSKKKIAALGTVAVFELKNSDHPFKLFIGKKCAVKFKRCDLLTTSNLGGLPTAEIIAVTDHSMTVLFQNREMVVRINDILVVIENERTAAS